MSQPRVVVVGAGIGGLAAASVLARAGLEPLVLEARDAAGGLASAVEFDGARFDAGPYVLLDRPGLSWAFERVGLDLDAELELLPLDPIYEVRRPGGEPIAIRSDAEATAEGFERRFPGAAKRYLAFLDELTPLYETLDRLRTGGPPGLLTLVRLAGPRGARFLLRSLGDVLRASGLPGPVREALGIWTHVAGQSLDAAPSPLAFVPLLMHRAGAWHPTGGVARVAERLAAHAADCGAELSFGSPVRRILTANGRVTGVETRARTVPARAVLSNAGLATYLGLLDRLPARAKRRLATLPLQSPGVGLYLKLASALPPPYLRFVLSDELPCCRLLLSPSAIPGAGEAGQTTARLLAPLPHTPGRPAEEYASALETLRTEPAWSDLLAGSRVAGQLTPPDWAERFHLHRESMNPVMTARFMRHGRLAHESPWVEGLYVAGSATHPGQWVSFCAISGVLAARRLLGRLG